MLIIHSLMIIWIRVDDADHSFTDDHLDKGSSTKSLTYVSIIADPWPF